MHVSSFEAGTAQTACCVWLIIPWARLEKYIKECSLVLGGPENFLCFPCRGKYSTITIAQREKVGGGVVEVDIWCRDSNVSSIIDARRWILRRGVTRLWRRV